MSHPSPKADADSNSERPKGERTNRCPPWEAVAVVCVATPLVGMVLLVVTAVAATSLGLTWVEGAFFFIPVCPSAVVLVGPALIVYERWCPPPRTSAGREGEVRERRANTASNAIQIQRAASRNDRNEGQSRSATVSDAIQTIIGALVQGMVIIIVLSVMVLSTTAVLNSAGEENAAWVTLYVFWLSFGFIALLRH